MKVLCVVPARSGSKRIPGKNMKPLNGITPMRRAVHCCEAAFRDEAQIVVTGDWIRRDEQVGGIEYHERPEALATDQASMVDVVLDVLQAYPGAVEQPVLLVQPTQPLRRPEHLTLARRLLDHHISIASVAETVSVDKLYRRENGYLIPLGGAVERDQHGTPTYVCDGTFYGFHRGLFQEHRTFRDGMHTHTIVIPPEETCRLDTPQDWLVASLLLQHASR